MMAGFTEEFLYLIHGTIGSLVARQCSSTAVLPDGVLAVLSKRVHASVEKWLTEGSASSTAGRTRRGLTSSKSATQGR